MLHLLSKAFGTFVFSQSEYVFSGSHSYAMLTFVYDTGFHNLAKLIKPLITFNYTNKKYLRELLLKKAIA